MKAEYSVLSDYRSWISLAGEVEYLFGPMTEEKTFQMALNHLDKDRDIFVQTFDDSVKEGKGARTLYTGFGFFDFKKAGNNPAGFPTVIMKLPAGGCQNI
jgi:hypothetical protein